MIRAKHVLAGVALGFGLATSAFAWPDTAVTIIVPFPPGGSTDTLARAIAPGLQAQLGQNFIVDNKPGATGTIGAALVKRAPADGYTLFVSSLGPFVIAPAPLQERALRSRPGLRSADGRRPGAQRAGGAGRARRTRPSPT